jgi:hypothetical protein
MTTSLIGGHDLGLLDSSATLLNRNDRTGAGTLGHGEQTNVNVSDGDLVVQEVDAFLPSRGADFQLVRTYNSRGKLGGAANWGWTWSTAIALEKHNDKKIGQSGNLTNYTLTLGDGSQLHFDFDATRNLWVSTDGAGAYATLQDASGGGFTVTRADQTQINFDKNFTLLSIVDQNGVRIAFDYQGNRLTRVRDDTGHIITFS